MTRSIHSGVYLALFLFLAANLLAGGAVRQIVNVDHFYSSMHIFEYAFDHGWRFGTDLVDNVGPLGFLHYPFVYTGGAYSEKMLWYALACLFCAAGTIAIAARMQGWPRRLAFIAVVAYFALQCNFPWYAYETIPRLAIVFPALWLLSAPPERWQRALPALVAALGAFYAALTVGKASNLYFLLFIIAVLSLFWLRAGRWRLALWLTGSYFACAAAFWRASGQAIRDVPAFLVSMSQFIASYQESLVMKTLDIYVDYGFFYMGAAALLLAGRIGAARLAEHRWLTGEVFRSALVAAVLFLTWKHGMLRGTPSYGTFVYVVPVVFAYLVLSPVSMAPVFAGRRASILASFLAASTGCALLAVVCVNVVAYERELPREGGLLREIKDRWLAWRDFAPISKRADLDAQLADLQRQYRMPEQLRQLIGAGTVDEFGDCPEPELLNALNYRPRPVPINFIVGTDALNRRNGDFYGNRATAPDFVFLDKDGLQLHDTRAYLELLVNYQPLQIWRDSLVMEKRADHWKEIRPDAVLRESGRFGDWVNVDGFGESYVWAQIAIAPTLYGTLRKALYRTENVRLDLALNNGETISVPTSIAKLGSGFLVNPFIGSRQDILDDAGRATPERLRYVHAIRIDWELPGSKRLFVPAFPVELTALTFVSGK